MRLFAGFTLAALVFTLSVRVQVAQTETKHFEKAGLAFDFPAEWKLIDKSSGEMQYFTVAPEAATTQISVIDQSASVSPCEKEAGKTITDALLERIATQIKATSPLQTAPVKMQIGSAEIDGVQLKGLLNNQPVTGEVYSLKLNASFVNLVYLRMDSDQQGQSAWEKIRPTMKIAPGMAMAMDAAKAGASMSPRAPISGGVLNGKAIRLAQPRYPAVAREDRVSGTVLIQVLIDESGNVIDAQVKSGHHLLQAASMAAARESKFSPTKLCGEPVRVTGFIQYNFVAR